MERTRQGSLLSLFSFWSLPSPLPLAPKGETPEETALPSSLMTPWCCVCMSGSIQVQRRTARHKMGGAAVNSEHRCRMQSQNVTAEPLSETSPALWSASWGSPLLQHPHEWPCAQMCSDGQGIALLPAHREYASPAPCSVTDSERALSVPCSFLASWFRSFK